MDRKLLDILCCPTSRQPLALLSDGEREAINAAIAAGTIRRADGQAQATPLAEGLITRDRRTVYRVEDGIPVLLAEEALDTAQVEGFPH
ncbi:MAG TPA: Trm112 family protein [Arenimonas sp.]|nr:Trm112 family protein [Arenimonas sp.]